jgi:hypothetical protein
VTALLRPVSRPNVRQDVFEPALTVARLIAGPAASVTHGMTGAQRCACTIALCDGSFVEDVR